MVTYAYQEWVVIIRPSVVAVQTFKQVYVASVGWGKERIGRQSSKLHLCSFDKNLFQENQRQH